MFPVTTDEFKTYFLREAGLEYQPYETFVKTTYDAGACVVHNDIKWQSLVSDNIEEPVEGSSVWEEIESTEEFPEWEAPKAYSKDDKVVAVVKFKPGVWVSLVDDNYSVPGEDETKWEYNEDETAELADVILDADIIRAMGEASFKFNPGMFKEEKGKLIFLYLTMFFLVYDRQMASSGMNGNSASGPVVHRTVGKMSVTYMESKLFSKYPSYEFLASNDYGRKAFNLLAPYLRGNVRILRGGSTGE